jgi:hypothetical protein
MGDFAFRFLNGWTRAGIVSVVKCYMMLRTAAEAGKGERRFAAYVEAIQTDEGTGARSQGQIGPGCYRPGA